MDASSLSMAVLGGVAMGTYPVPIKCRAVVDACVHPLVFQCYKSAWVFATGFLFLIPNAMRGTEPVFEFTWWAVLSAAAWIPAGICTIAAVPRIGMGMAMLLNAGTCSWLSFLVFWFFEGERMRQHNVRGHEVYLAPVYLASMMLGMSQLVAVGAEPVCASATHAELIELVSEEDNEKAWKLKKTLARGGRWPQRIRLACFIESSLKSLSIAQMDRDWLLGVSCAVMGGVLSAIQAAAVTIGRQHAMQTAGCTELSACPADVRERFNSCSSWVTSFGIGALLVCAAYVLAFCAYSCWHGLTVPSPCLEVMWRPGSIAGLLWCVGNFFLTLAVTRGGNAVMVPAGCAVCIISSGSWGLFYYKEVHGRSRVFHWCGAAIFTLMSMLLLSAERS